MTEQVKKPPAMQEIQEVLVRSLSWENPLEEEMATHPTFLPGKSHGQRSLVGYSPKGCKESDTTEHISPLTGKYTAPWEQTGGGTWTAAQGDSGNISEPP